MKQRQNRLTRLLGQRSEYEPRRRQDADAVVLFARPEDARLTRPLLRFHRQRPAGIRHLTCLPGSYNINDKDMDGLMFCDMPWLLADEPRAKRLNSTLTGTWPTQSAQLTRLQAFGIDAYDLLPYLPDLHSGQRQSFAGVTGLLTVSDGHTVERSLIWAKFHRGEPRILTPIVIDESVPVLQQPLKEEQDVWQLPLSPSPAGPTG